MKTNATNLKSCLDFFISFYTRGMALVSFCQTNSYAQQKRGLTESSVKYPVAESGMKAWISI